MAGREVLLSLHDVAPFHLERLRRAERVLETLGVRRIAYLLVPDFHRRGASDARPDFLAWCRGPRRFEVEWCLHGYSHRDDPAAPVDPGLLPRVRRRFLTGGEGEFSRLGAAEARDRVERGRRVFRACLGADPEGFVPPAWLYGRTLPEVLRETGFRWYEDRSAVYGLRGGAVLRSPVVTWATRTRLLRWSSLAGCPLLLRWWRGVPVLRLAVHPFDFDHPATVRAIVRVWRAVLAERRQRSYSGLSVLR